MQCGDVRHAGGPNNQFTISRSNIKGFKIETKIKKERVISQVP